MARAPEFVEAKKPNPPGAFATAWMPVEGWTEFTVELDGLELGDLEADAGIIITWVFEISNDGGKTIKIITGGTLRGGQRPSRPRPAGYPGAIISWPAMPPGMTGRIRGTTNKTISFGKRATPG